MYKFEICYILRRKSMYLRTWGSFKPAKKLGFANHKSTNSSLQIHGFAIYVFAYCPSVLKSVFCVTENSAKTLLLSCSVQCFQKGWRARRMVFRWASIRPGCIYLASSGILVFPLPTIQPWWYSTSNHSTMVAFQYQPFNHGGIPLPTIQPWWYSTTNHSTMVVFH